MRRGSALVLLFGLLTACNGHDRSTALDGSGGATEGEPDATTGSEDDSESGAPGETGDDCGDVVCDDNEVCDPETLACVCAEGTHACDDVCVEDDSVDHCGDACSPCPDDPNGVASCVDGACTLECNEGFEACADGCCPVDTGVIWDGSGAGASIAVDAANAPHVSFLANVSDLSYAYLGPSGWIVEMLDGESVQQRPTAIALDGDGEPIIAYRGSWSIQVARPGEAGWTHEAVYTSSSGYGPVVGPRGLAVDGAGVPHIVAEQRADSGGASNSDIWHLWWDGEEWARENVLSAFDNRYSLPSIAIGPDDAVHVAWVSYFDDGLHYAVKTAEGWTRITALDNAYCCDDAYIALDPAAAPFVAYEADDLGYVVGDGSSDPWTFAALHDPLGLVGDIAFDGAGGLVYSLATDGDVILGRPGGGGWEEATVLSGAEAFMMALDHEDAAHFVASTENALVYTREPAP